MPESPVTFTLPGLLWLLLLVPVIIFFYLRNQKQRKKMAEKLGIFGGSNLRNGSSSGARRHIPYALFLIGIIILTVAIARPKMKVSLPHLEETVMLVFDVSGSMAADDVKPSRLEAAKAVARDFVSHQPSNVQIGAVVFSESGFSIQLPSNDQQAIIASIDRIEPQRGTSLASGIQISLNSILKQTGQIPEDSEDFAPELLPTPTPLPEGTYSSAVIVLLTDGENNMNPDPLAAAKAAADWGVRVHTIGFGSPTGTTLQVDGFMVHTQMDETILRRIAELTDGVYYNAQNEEDLQAIYSNITPKLVFKSEPTEVTSIFAGVSMFFMLLGGALSLYWLNRVP